MQYTERIHRWCYFPDSWSPLDVQKIISELTVDDREWIWDPFGGAGTTALVAAENKIRSISSDIDPLAALVAQIKINPPSRKVLERSVWLAATSAQEIFGDLANYPTFSPSIEIQTLRFMIIAALIRTGWHLGERFDDDRVRTEFGLLKNEMLRDCTRSPSRTQAHVYCSDFVKLVPLVCRLTKGKTVMITSPPFLGTNGNPKLRKLKRAIGLLESPEGRRKRLGIWDYRRILDSICFVADQIGCRMVAIELSARKTNQANVKETASDFLVRRLKSAGFSTLISPFSADEGDPSVLCVGKRDRIKSPS